MPMSLLMANILGPDVLLIVLLALLTSGLTLWALVDAIRVPSDADFAPERS